VGRARQASTLECWLNGGHLREVLLAIYFDSRFPSFETGDRVVCQLDPGANCECWSLPSVGRTIGVMQKGMGTASWVWLMTMAFAGAGCNFLGPYLASISVTWQLQDRQAGILLSCLFFGSFTGTLLLGNHLARTLRIGAYGASIGLLLLATMSGRSKGFAGGAVGLAIMGFGLGQLMSSINLIVGASPIGERSRQLANIGVAWCLGAVLSPMLTTVLLQRVSPVARLSLFAPAYLLPVVFANEAGMPIHVAGPARNFESSVAAQRWRMAFSWVFIFLIYGGIEASIGGWISLFALRYHLEEIGQAQWIMSLFWIGLIAGRLIIARLVTPAREIGIVHLAMIGSVCSLFWLVASRSPLALSIGIAITGVCLAPLFPLLLSATIECGLSPRLMGGVLAASGLGAALFPLLLGAVSSTSSLRTAMLVPLFALLLLILLRWRPGPTPRIFRLL
jgi:FHS family glucose/mannose:H+ symporter-like MFS transporter